jgi:2-polyprenyl-3-methyl-5-hydroxy-6-metoxy-1,4-benzoquinol methylase
MNSDQQKQTKDFFEKFSQEWKKSVQSISDDSVNMIKQRNNFVENCSKNISSDSKTLDVGCGTGDLVINLLQNGFDAYGIDFSSEMIKTAKNSAQNISLSSEHFHEISFFNFNSNIVFELISANGFIEYISPSQLEDFLKKSNQLLSKDGLLVFGSRNRLFNVFSMNSFTLDEIESKNIDSLIRESTIFNSCTNMQEVLNNFEPISLESPDKQSMTDIDVNMRYQYTPFQLFTLLHKYGFEILNISPIHIHGITPAGKKIDPQLHTSLSNFLQSNTHLNFQLLPQSSSFMIEARKS